MADTLTVIALQERIHILETQLSERQQAERELNALYDAQCAYLEQQPVPWCHTPFARRIADLEAQLGY